jgi:hypothetical protein
MKPQYIPVALTTLVLSTLSLQPGAYAQDNVGSGNTSQTTTGSTTGSTTNGQQQGSAGYTAGTTTDTNGNTGTTTGTTAGTTTSDTTTTGMSSVDRGATYANDPADNRGPSAGLIIAIVALAIALGVYAFRTSRRTRHHGV